MGLSEFRENSNYVEKSHTIKSVENFAFDVLLASFADLKSLQFCDAF